MAEGMHDPFRAFFTAEFPDVQLGLIGHHGELASFMDRADVVMSFGKTLGPHADRLLGGAPRLKWVQSLGTGVNNIADLPSLRRDVVITSMRGIHGIPMSETAIMLMMALARDLPGIVRNQDKRSWLPAPARHLHGKTVGILGVGAIAETMAPLCGALGMTVIGISATPRELAGFHRIVARDRMVEIVPELDFFVLLAPITPETYRIIDARILAAMRLTSFLINIGRGDLVDEQALLEALTNERIAGAALDAFSQEPLPPGHPLWAAKNVIITPHIGGDSETTAQDWFSIIRRNMRAFLARDLAGMVNVVRAPPQMG
jgi:phosphoglycerate dehydrogenase-like enzyme